jgi:hypothetical protein
MVPEAKLERTETGGGAAAHHGAAVSEPTSSTADAYARFPAREATRYRSNWLSDG